MFHLDANRAALDVYNVGWKAYLQQRETDERRRKRERANAEKQAAALKAQADKMRAKATKAKRGAEHGQAAPSGCSAGLEDARAADKVAKLRFPDPAPCGKTPLTADGLSKSYGSLEIFTDVDLAIDRGSPGRRPRPQRRGQDHPAAAARRRRAARHRRGRCRATGSSSATTRRSTRRSTPSARCWRTCARAAPDLADAEVRKVLGSFLFSGDDVDKPAGVLSGGEKTRLALATLVVSSANVLLLDEPTNNLDPASRERGPRRAAHATPGAVVLVTHDEGAVEALEPERVHPAARRRRGPLEPATTRDLVALA